MEQASVIPSNGGVELERETHAPFYENAATYWSHVPATVDGMLGGFGFVSSIDINSSSHFLKNLFKSKVPPGKKRALDCGAGIGRISKYLLLERFGKVDLVEQNPAFLEQAASFIGANKHLGNMFCSGLQNFTPDPNTYDVIWCQWVLGHLIDEDLKQFLQNCRAGLKPNGVIVVKENVTRDGKTEFDETDSSVTRSLTDLMTVLESTGLKCIRVQKQERFPQVLYPVYMFALRPQGGVPPVGVPPQKSKEVTSEKTPQGRVTEDAIQVAKNVERSVAEEPQGTQVTTESKTSEQSASELSDLLESSPTLKISTDS